MVISLVAKVPSANCRRPITYQAAALTSFDFYLLVAYARAVLYHLGSATAAGKVAEVAPANNTGITATSHHCD
jgi:hypothetical protein